jgi:hypothetical protein
MGGGDLNLKKSWHVALQSNQKKVWNAEKGALEERKKIEVRKRELEEERSMMELARMQEAAGGAPRQNRVDWMYQGSNAGTNNLDNEAYLLGKRRVDNLILKEKEEVKEAKPEQFGIADVAPAISARDIVTKTALDPLLAIEKQKQDMIEREIEKQIRQQKLRERREKKHSSRDDRERHRHHHRRHRHRDREEDSDEERYRKRRRYEDDYHRESRYRPRSRTPVREREDESERSRRHHRRSRSTDSSYERHSRRSRHGYEPHSSSTVRDESEPRKYRQRSRSPRRRDDNPENRRRSDRRSRSPKRRDSEQEMRKRPRRSGGDEEELRATKLAAMQSNATALEEDRNKRLAEMEERDAREKAAEDQRREKDDGSFKSSLQRKAADAGLEARLRGRRSEVVSG